MPAQKFKIEIEIPEVPITPKSKKRTAKKIAKKASAVKQKVAVKKTAKKKPRK